ncbi:MAG: multiubiquitin domain-containing protein [Prosthecobacter sp.]|jgi:hypothetical protein|uniref:multiubiquitin domain-containing protein n=1 Tax=Prosthecobacter sp. TaxID=1965333 RepID=UPI0019DFC5B4|nr:multiubiquitin domain-containing protein [Prosthecobacter sp.]MBE2287485.1 multiubiquitin domain-containing protein [Prosthecobacter sp.]
MNSNPQNLTDAVRCTPKDDSEPSQGQLDVNTQSGHRLGVESSHHLLISDESFQFHPFRTSDRKITGAQVAELAGKHPVTDFVVLKHLKTHELESLRPTELADLGEDGIERFFVIQSGEIYRFTVEGLSMEWPRGSIRCSNVKFLAGIPADECLVLDVGDCKRVLEDDDMIELKCPGVEELRIRKGPKTVTVKYGDKEFTLQRREYTTEELMKEFGVPAGYRLDLISKDGEFRELKPGEKIKVKDCMEFSSHVPTGQSS